MIIYLIAIALVLCLCYWFSRFIAKKMNNTVSGDKIKVIERVALGQDKGIAICRICSKYYIIGISNQNVEILSELEPEQFEQDEQIPKENFLDLMNQVLKKNKSKH